MPKLQRPEYALARTPRPCGCAGQSILHSSFGASEPILRDTTVKEVALDRADDTGTSVL